MFADKDMLDFDDDSLDDPDFALELDTFEDEALEEDIVVDFIIDTLENVDERTFSVPTHESAAGASQAKKLRTAKAKPAKLTLEEKESRLECRAAHIYGKQDPRV